MALPNSMIKLSLNMEERWIQTCQVPLCFLFTFEPMGQEKIAARVARLFVLYISRS